MASSSSSSSIQTTFVSTAGRELLLELQRHQQQQQQQQQQQHSSNSTLPPPYHLKLVRQCLDDLQVSFERLSQEVQAAQGGKHSMASRPSMLYHHACIQRHKRCLLTYHKHRLAAFQRAVVLLDCIGTNNMDTDDNIDTTTTTTADSWSTHAAELDFIRSYRALRQQYVQAVLPDGDEHYYFQPDAPPPCASSNAVQVRCQRSLGPVVLASGRSVTLTQGSIHYLPHSDIVGFLHDGTLQVLDGEEVDF